MVGSPRAEPSSTAEPIDTAEPVYTAENVYTHADLVLALDRLRRSAASGGRPRISYARLANRVGIPASTLHTYFTGSVVPASDMLDRIVRGLGATAPMARKWASALERVNDTSFASANAVGPSATSRMRRHHDDVRAQMPSALRRSVEQSRHLLVSSLVTVDAARAIRSMQVRIVVQALADGVDRDAIQLVTSLEKDHDQIHVTRTVNCDLVGERSLHDPAVRLVEVSFDHALDAGEMYSYEYTASYVSSPARLEQIYREAGPDNPYADGGGVSKTFLSGGTYYCLDVQFDPAAAPKRVIQTQRASFVDHRRQTVVREIPLSSWCRASLLVECARPGVTGMQWFF